MKTVTGKVISSEPVTISKAASILSKFASSENGATQAISAYLRRASAAFNELKGLHRDINASTLKEKKPRSDVALERNPNPGSDDPFRPDDVSRGTHDGVRKKKHKKKEKESGGIAKLVENGGEIGGKGSETVREEELSHERAQVSQGPSQDGESERNKGKKKKNSRKDREEDENADDRKVTTRVIAEDGHMKEEKKEKKKKKRKIDGEMGSEEKKSKKRRKVKEFDS